jgi:hypothetical protein
VDRVLIAAVIKACQASFEYFAQDSEELGLGQIGGAALERMEECTGHACKNGVPKEQA